MPKSNRKVPARQRSPEYIAGAKRLKSIGLLGPKTNLHSGKRISKYAAQQVEKYAEIIAGNYSSVKLPKAQIAEAKAKGFVTKANRVIVPKEKVRTVKKSGVASMGVRPIPGGVMEVVTLPHDIMDMRRLANVLGEGGLNDMKQPDELFAFRFKGEGIHGVSYQPFLNTQSLLNYLYRYQSIFDQDGSLNEDYEDENFDGFELLKLRRQDVGKFIKPKREREEQARKSRKRNIKTVQDRRKAVQQLRENWDADRLRRFNERKANRERERRASMTPEQKAEYNKKGLARALKSKARKSK